MSNDVSKRTAVCCILDSNPRFFADFVLWTHCLRLYGGDNIDLHAFVPSSDIVERDTVEAFCAENNVHLHFTKVLFRYSLHCNKIIPFIELKDSDYKAVIFTDTDVFVVKNFFSMLSQTNISAAPNNHNNPPQHIYRQILRGFDPSLQVKPGVALYPQPPYGRETFRNNNSAGVVCCPNELLPTFGEAWRDAASWLLKHRDLMGRWGVHVDQVSLALWADQRGIDLDFMPPQFNFILPSHLQMGDIYAFHMAHGHRNNCRNLFHDNGTLVHSRFHKASALSIVRFEDALSVAEKDRPRFDCLKDWDNLVLKSNRGIAGALSQKGDKSVSISAKLKSIGGRSLSIIVARVPLSLKQRLKPILTGGRHRVVKAEAPVWPTAATAAGDADAFQGEQDGPEPKETAVRAVAFYLPQFHTIPENDEWWGKGFTEWTHTNSGYSLYDGHHQPRKPVAAPLGEYDLTDVSVMAKQCEMARKAGIEGFAFYYYDFGNKRLLDQPIINYLNDKSLDRNFCLFWANHPWTRRWYGQDREVLMSIPYGPEFYDGFIERMAPFLKDERYIRVNGRPVIMMLHWNAGDGPGSIKECARMIDRWRNKARELGVGEIFVMGAQLNFDVHILPNAEAAGLDSLFEFAPTAELNGGVPNLTPPDDIADDFTGKLLSYPAMIDRRMKFHDGVNYALKPCMTTQWDNTARYKAKSTSFVGFNQDQLRRWSQHNYDFAIRKNPEAERFFFINGWNEWSEGSYLEPDDRYGYANLNTVRGVIATKGKTAS